MKKENTNYIDILQCNISKNKISKKRNKGFTLVELIVVISIIAILATISFVGYSDYLSGARDANRISTMKDIEKGLELYKISASSYPEPDSRATYTGGNITLKQGVIGDSVSNQIKLSTTPKDPLTKNNYTYSTILDGRYYQLRQDLEQNELSLLPQAYAKNTTTIVRGNYKMDPSLPSLIIVPSSVNSSSGIFDPNVCFVMDRGKNSLDNCVEKKEDMSLKDFDSGLIGYWDMETTNGSLLKDLSENGHDLILSGGMVYSGSSTGSIIGKGLIFDGNGFLYTMEGTGSNLEINDEINNGDFSLVRIIKATYSDYDKYPLSDIVTKSGNYALKFRYGKTMGGYGSNISFTGSLGNACGWTDDIYNDCRLYATGSSPNIYMTGTWYENKINKLSLNENVYIVFSKNKNNSNLYINGNKIFSYKTLGMNKIYNTPFVIGGHEAKYNNWFNDFIESSRLGFKGIIDEVKIYNRALTDEEIAQQARIAGLDN